jgi:ATP synthase protein I
LTLRGPPARALYRGRDPQRPALAQGRTVQLCTYNPEALLQAPRDCTMTDSTASAAHGATGDGFEDEATEAPFKRLTREEAAALRTRIASVSPWRVVAAQAVAGLLCGAAAWLLTQRSGVVWSSLYGAAAVVVPGALLARGITRGSSPNPGAAVYGFMLWETVKIGVAVAMLVAAAKVVPDLSWPALLVAMVVCMKVNWLALLWWRRPVVT